MKTLDQKMKDAKNAQERGEMLAKWEQFAKTLQEARQSAVERGDEEIFDNTLAECGFVSLSLDKYYVAKQQEGAEVPLNQVPLGEKMHEAQIVQEREGMMKQLEQFKELRQSAIEDGHDELFKNVFTNCGFANLSKYQGTPLNEVPLEQKMQDARYAQAEERC